jgi:hypothetical protein
MFSKRGEGEFTGELGIFKQRLDALEFKITSFDELEEKIFDFFGQFEDNVKKIVEEEIKNNPSEISNDKVKELEDKISKLADETKNVLSGVTKKKGGKSLDFEKILAAKVEELEEKIVERLAQTPKEEVAEVKEETQEEVIEEKVKSEGVDAKSATDPVPTQEKAIEQPKKHHLFSLHHENGKHDDSLHKKINNLSKEFDEFQRETVPEEYIHMIEAEFRSKIQNLTDKIENKIPASKDKIKNTEADYEALRREIESFRANELMPAREATTSVNEDIAELRKEINAIRQNEVSPLSLSKSKSKKIPEKEVMDPLFKESFETEIALLKTEIAKLKESPIIETSPSDFPWETKIEKFDNDYSELRNEISNLNELVANIKGKSISNDDFSLHVKKVNVFEEELSQFKDDITQGLRGSFDDLRKEWREYQKNQVGFGSRKQIIPMKKGSKNIDFEGFKKDIVAGIKVSFEEIREEISAVREENHEFKNYATEQIQKVSEWLSFLNRCIK